MEQQPNLTKKQIRRISDKLEVLNLDVDVERVIDRARQACYNYETNDADAAIKLDDDLEKISKDWIYYECTAEISGQVEIFSEDYDYDDDYEASEYKVVELEKETVELGGFDYKVCEAGGAEYYEPVMNFTLADEDGFEFTGRYEFDNEKAIVNYPFVSSRHRNGILDASYPEYMADLEEEMYGDDRRSDLEILHGLDKCWIAINPDAKGETDALTHLEDYLDDNMGFNEVVPYACQIAQQVSYPDAGSNTNGVIDTTKTLETPLRGLAVSPCVRYKSVGMVQDKSVGLVPGDDKRVYYAPHLSFMLYTDNEFYKKVPVTVRMSDLEKFVSVEDLQDKLDQALGEVALLKSELRDKKGISPHEERER